MPRVVTLNFHCLKKISKKTISQKNLIPTWFLNVSDETDRFLSKAPKERNSKTNHFAFFYKKTRSRTNT